MTRINLLRPRLPSRQSAQRLRLAGVGAALGLALLLSLSASLWAGAAGRLAAGALARVEEQRAREARHVAEWQALKAETRALEARAALLAQVERAAVRFAPLSGRIWAAAPPGCSVKQLILAPTGELIVKGEAESHREVADFVDRLRTVPGVERMEVEASSRTTGSGRVAFSLRGAMGGGAQ